MARKTIRSLLKEEKPLVLPGAHDALSALLIKQAGFKGFFIGGFQTAGARHGLPDIGLCQLGEFGAAFRELRFFARAVELAVGEVFIGHARHLVGPRQSRNRFAGRRWPARRR